MEMYQVDAFTDQLFAGNPAAIIIREDWPTDEVMQAIAMENNLSETAFIVQEQDHYRIRWFTPVKEVQLCGHATLAAGHVFYHHLGYDGDAIVFNSLSGLLTVRRQTRGYSMDFPADMPKNRNDPGGLIEKAFGLKPLDIVRGTDDYLALFRNQAEVLGLNPDFGIVRQIDCRGVLATARGDEHDFVSRCFFPAFGIDEDPVTGSAHTLLAPYWFRKIKKDTLRAAQLSRRGGEIVCTVRGDRVDLSGSAVTYATANINI